MEIRTEYTSPLKMQKLLIAESSFKRSEESLRNLGVDVRINRKIEDAGTNTYKIILELFMHGEEGKLDISVKCIAYFETLQNNISLIEKNAVAIMFPYLRSYVTNITSQPGMLPIVLPPINVAAMFQEN